ncbi:MAG: sulfurtransferase [Myxococcota bacterium]|nr:sulfurtransferase [Myxococcota bacterium]MDW8362964.1 sulfurtransferase [Myxococcales bacterium]
MTELDPTSVLVSAQQLRDGLGSVRLVDVRPESAFRAGHIAGALRADLERDLSADASDPSRGGRHPLPVLDDFALWLGRIGIGAQTPVVVYDAESGASGASRLWWMLRAVGHERVWLLDGGLQAARVAGLPMAEGESSAPPADCAPYPVRPWRLPVASIEEVERRALDPDWLVLDARAPERFAGLLEPIDPVAGHVPGARNLFHRTLLDDDGAFLPVERLRALWQAALGGRAPQRVIVGCGSGVTACQLLVGMERCGLKGAALWVGSWSQWCRSGRPVATGAAAAPVAAG